MTARGLKSILVAAVLAAFSGGILGQQTRDDRTRERGSAVPTGGTVAAPAASSTSTGSVPSVRPRGGLPPGGPRSASVPVNGPGVRGGGPDQIPVQTYTPNARWSLGDFYRYQSFFDRLSRSYQSIFPYEYLWRYAQGDSPLTPTVMGFALENATEASSSLVELADDLKRLLVDFEAGALEHPEFEERFDATLSQVRRRAKQIRTDHSLSFLDLRRSPKTPGHVPVSSTAELHVLVDRLAEAALRIQQGVLGLAEETRVVSVESLREPSLVSLSRTVEQLARTIERSASRL